MGRQKGYLAKDATLTAIVAWGLRAEQPKGVESIIVVAGAQGNWLMRAEENSTVLSVQTVDRPACEKAFLQMAAPLTKARGL